MLEKKVLRHFDEGDHVRIFKAYNVSESSLTKTFKRLLLFFLEGFSYGDRRILHKERSVSRIWTAFCVLRKHTAEVCNFINSQFYYFVK